MQLTTSDNQWSFSPVDTYGLRLAGGSSGTFFRFRPGGGASKEVNITVSGDVSGSSTSTGSFGSLFLHGGNTLKVDPTTNRFLAEGTTSGRGFMVRDIDHNSSASFYQSGASTRIEAHTGTAINFLIGGTTYAYVDNDGQMHVSATGQDHKPGYTFITDTDTGMYHAGTDALGLTVGGTEQLRIASNTISGSLTSTGSFGMLHAEGIKGLNGNYTGTLFIPEILALGNDTDTMIRKYTSNVLEFRCGGVDVARFDGNNAKFVVEGSGGIEVESGNIVSTKANGLISGSSSSTASFGEGHFTGQHVGIGVKNTSGNTLYVNSVGNGQSARFATDNVLNYIHITNSGGANHYIQTNQHSVALSADANNTRGSVHLMTGNTNRLNVTSDGNVEPGADDSYKFRFIIKKMG